MIVDFFDLNKIWAFYGLLGLAWLFFSDLANNIVERISGTTEKNKLLLFNDAVSNELMRIRSDLVNIRLNQDRYGDDSIPPLRAQESYETPGEWLYARSCNKFLRMYWMCNEYSSSFQCQPYKTPEGTWGMIIINLHDHDANETCNDIFLREFDAEKLIKMHTHKMYKFVTGMNIQVYVYESGIIGHPGKLRNAKILSINKVTKYGDIEFDTITLEISLNELYHRPLFDGNEEKIIRTIELTKNTSCDLVFDIETATKKNSQSLTYFY